MRHPRRGVPSARVALLTLATAATAATTAACAPDAPSAPSLDAAVSSSSWNKEQGDKHVVVMTRNVYLGADLNPVIAAPAPLIPIRVAETWAKIRASNFPERAQALADEIVAARADIVGLQEVELYRIQSPGDALVGGRQPATTVAYDFLQLLLDALAARGEEYTAVSTSWNTDIEAPAINPANLGGACATMTAINPACFDDVRLTDRDVIIARAGVATSNPRAGLYAARVVFQLGGAGGPAVAAPRGWTSVDVTVDKHRAFRFFNTHLEVEGGALGQIQALQGNEMLALLAGSPLPVVLVGDFNSNADQSETPTYGNILAAGYTDAWTAMLGGGEEPGLTCCQSELLRNPTSLNSKRIDIIWYRGNFMSMAADVMGDEPSDRTPSGLWPSDHSGVAAVVKVKK
jgi:endonuclease/exonuclease/phosphatase family metal-dependent hydrolase